MKELFLNVVEISIATSFVLFVLLVFSSYLGKRYATKWKYLIWIAIAIRLIIPFNFRWTERQIVVDVPAQVTAPIHVNVGNAVPIALQDKPEIAQITPLDLAACLWLAGCLLFLSVHIVSYLRFRKRVLRDGETVEEEAILRRICELSGELRINPDIRVMRYPDAGSPMMIGFFRPALVLPDDAYSEEELFFILKHELVHVSRHDVSFKLLFVAANAVHWFNPLVYAMRKEAMVDMELSCDERVIRQTSYAVRKAYTEALFSTLSRQQEKETTLTTQFYGGKRVMKKRFKNILMKSKKRNGVMVSMCAVSFTLASGMLVGCSVVDTISSGVQAQSRFEAEKNDMQAENPDVRTDAPDAQIETPQAIPVIAEPESGQENAGQDADHEENPETALPADSEQMKRVVEKFAAAYFSGDVSAVKALLPDSYAWDVEAYEGTGDISDISVKGLPDAGEQKTGSVWTVSMQYRDSTYEDMFQYLTIELIKQDTGWEIQFYGLEG